MKRKVFVTVIIFMIIIVSLVIGFSMSPTKNIEDISIVKGKKPIILITVDSLMSESLENAIKEGKAPAFKYLMEKGQYYPEIISSYPTMSVTIDSTVLTGTYADKHKIPGLIWYKEDEKRIVSYGSGLREIWNLGVKNVAFDSIVNLNENHLSKNVLTIHEELSKRHIPSASINGLLYRGNHAHELTIPPLVSTLDLLPNEIKVSGPTILSLGALSYYSSDNIFHKFAWQRVGVNNQFTVNELKHLIKQKKLPPFTLSYFPDADRIVHKNGPRDVTGIERADQQLQELLNLYPTWEEAINQTIWIVHGDSAQSSVLKDKSDSLIDLNKLLNDYTFWDAKRKDSDLAISINERMAYINILSNSVELTNILNTLKTDERIAFIAYKENGKNYVVSPKTEEVFSFSQDGQFRDIYDQSWELNGDYSLLDLSINEIGHIEYGDYPDALSRLHGALHSHEGKFVIVDAQPNYEFIEKHSHDHAGGGAHGSLHKIDSVVPVIIAGTTEKPKYLRLVDFKEWILRMTE